MDQAEEILVKAGTRDIVQWSFPSIQNLGIPFPSKIINDDFDWLAAKVKGALLTNGNTALRPTARTLLTFLLLHGPFQLDVRMLAHAAVKSVVSDVINAAAAAGINRLHERESKGD